MKRQKNILLALGWYDHRLLRGISTYAEQHNWHLAAQSIINERVIPWGWQGDGVLAWLASGDDLADFVVSVNRPTVDFSMRRPQLPFARVIQDHALAGKLVAEYFLARGFQSFLFYSNLDNWSQEQRGEGFVNALKQAGQKCDWIRWHETKVEKGARSDWAERQAWMITRLKHATKPTAIFVANGSLAVEVQEVCDHAAIDVPGEVAIVGIEDYLLSFRSGRRSISGVDMNLEEQGYQGAALLDRMMRGGKRPMHAVRIAPAQIITRRSSDIFAVSHAGVAKALHFISENFGKPIGVEEVAVAACMSVRGLHEAFGDHLNCTPGDKIRTIRLDYAKRLLATSDDKIESIAQQSGYPNINTFFIAFRKTEHMTPGAFRKVTRRGR